jgi:ArsR family transcriptional regulator
MKAFQMNERLFAELMMLHNRICLALGDPKRLMILYLLHAHPHSVKELTRLLDIPQPTVSRHLKILRERSLVKTQRAGSTVCYSLADTRIIQAIDLLREILRDTAQQQASLANFTALDAEREEETQPHTTA